MKNYKITDKATKSIIGVVAMTPAQARRAEKDFIVKEAVFMTQNVIKSTSNGKIYTIDGFDGVKVYEYPDIVSKKWYRKLEYNGIVGCEHPAKKKLTEDIILNFIEAVDDFNSKGKMRAKVNADYCRKYSGTSVEGIMQGLIFKYEL